MTLRAAFGIVGIAVADLRRRPAHEAELRNQLLLGEVVRISAASPNGQWLRVTGLEDEYSGWTKSWGLVPASARTARNWQQRARARIVALVEPVISSGPGRQVLLPAFFGARAEPGKARGRRIEVRLPDGREGTVSRRALRLPGEPPVKLVRRIATLAGVPYLWGGRTCAGLDCSGFTQLVLAEQGVRIPRDARDQFRSTRRLRGAETPATGDLIFFGRRGETVSHVGIMVDQGTYVHCRGSVHASSLDPFSPLCESELLAQMRGVRRPFGPP